MPRRSRAAAIVCAAAALIGFSGNSLLARVALRADHTDASTFTLIRLVSGAAVLLVIAAVTRRRIVLATSIGWLSGAALFAYAAAFSFAYLELGAGPGALILFGAVQATMIGWGLAKGERLGLLTWFGLLLALCGLAALTPPSGVPERAAAGLMAFAGVAWGVYSLLGRRSTDPIGLTTANFVLSVPLAVALSVATRGGYQTTARGVFFAMASGALASGVGYSFWYAALPSLSASQAAITQLVVPVLTAVAAVVLLDEPMTLRLLLSGAAIVGGVLVALAASQRRAP
jgi:drug/metabolite transporter (DMT)-like permease